MAAGTFPNDWSETCLVTILEKGGTGYHYGAITETVDVSEGDYPGESIKSVGGGRIWKQSAMEDSELTLEMYPINISQASNTGLFQDWVGGTATTVEPLASDIAWTSSDRLRDRFLVAILWTTDAAATSAIAATTAADSVALRFSAKECRITSHKSAFTDGILKITVTFKFPAFDKAGTTKSGLWESTDNTETGQDPLPALTYS
jgi:hypothetical protein